MSKERAILIERRSRRVKGMDNIIAASDNKEVIRGWECYTNGRAYSDIAEDEELYRACCQYFDRVDRDSLWGVDIAE